ncbi:hypothetical protein ACHAP8_012364 [Fusarium lateritium]
MSGNEITAATVNVKEPEDGDNVWKIEQVEVETLSYDDSGNSHTLDWSFGPFKLNGFLDTDTLDITVSPTLTGINGGTIAGNLKDGVVMKYNLLTTVGETRLYLKNGNETWVHLDLKVKFDGHFEGDYRLLTF